MYKHFFKRIPSFKGVALFSASAKADGQTAYI